MYTHYKWKLLHRKDIQVQIISEKQHKNACKIHNMQLSSEDLTVKHSTIQSHSLSHAALKHHTCPLALGDVHIEDTKVNISKQFCLVLSLSTLPTLRSVSKLNK